jgi:hypothetical protein
LSHNSRQEQGEAMQQLVKLYEENRPLIEKFILSTLTRLNFEETTLETYKKLHETFPSLELMYECDKDLVQISANLGEDFEEIEHIGRKRDYLIEEKELSRRYFISDPYISSATGNLCITVIYKHNDGYLFLDFRLRSLLERFHMIEANTRFRKLSRFAYFLIGGGLLAFGLFVSIYGLVSFGIYLFSEVKMDLEIFFKPVIALTLGLAVFDLGKTIYEQEVLPRTQNISDGFNPKSLITFMASIMIALLIEALLIVFKISINDYHDLPYAAVLIIAIALLLFVFGRFVQMKQVKEENLNA